MIADRDIQRRNAAVLDAIEKHTQKHMTDPASEWQSGYDAGIEAAAKALEADAMKCDCAALEERECGCGAWCEWKSITSARAVEIVRALVKETPFS